MPAAVNAAHLVEMPLKMPIPQELPENLLLHARHRRRIKSADGAVTLHQLLWKHHITDTQRRRDTFGKCSKINYLPESIHALQRRNRLSTVTVLAVVIVLDQIALLLLRRPRKKFQSSAQRHDAAGRELMGRHHVDKLRCRRTHRTAAKSLLVRRHRHHPVSHIPEGVVCLRISRVLHEHGLISSEKLREQNLQILISGSEHDVFRAAVYPSGVMQIIRNLTAQTVLPLSVPRH